MDSNNNLSTTIIETINSIFDNLFSSIDSSLYNILDDLAFIDLDILQDKYFGKILGTSASSGILLICNSLLIGFVLYFSIKYFTSIFGISNSNQTSKIENPLQFIFKLIIFGICMNCSYFILEQILNINSYISSIIRSIGEDLFKQNICFSNLITSINNNLKFTDNSLNMFSIDGLIKGTSTISLLNLVTSYAIRYIMLKVFILLSPFAILSLSLEKTSWFFKLWSKNIFTLLFIQIIISLILLILFSIDYNSKDLIIKFIYLGGIYSLIKANSFVREFISGMGIST